MSDVLSLILVFFLRFSLFLFKSVYLKIFIVVMWYPMLILAFFLNGFSMPGILGMHEAVLNGYIASIGLQYYLVGFVLFCAILFPLRNRKVVFPLLAINYNTRLVLLILASIGAMPLLNTHSESGIKTATAYLVFSVFLLLTHEKKDTLWFFHFCLSMSLIALGERVDSLLIIVLLFLVKGNKKFAADFSDKKIYLGGILFFVILVAVGYIRGNESFTIDMLVNSFVSQRTVCDVTYIYLTSISYILEHGCKLEVMSPLFLGVLPGEGVTSTLCYTNFLSKYMYNPGGGLFFSEGVVALGLLGVIVYISSFALFLRIVVNSKKIYSSIIFLFFCVMACRVTWYGMFYIYKPILLGYILYKIFHLKKYFVKIL